MMPQEPLGMPRLTFEAGRDAYACNVWSPLAPAGFSNVLCNWHQVKWVMCFDCSITALTIYASTGFEPSGADEVIHLRAQYTGGVTGEVTLVQFQGANSVRFNAGTYNMLAGHTLYLEHIVTSTTGFGGGYIVCVCEVALS